MDRARVKYKKKYDVVPSADWREIQDELSCSSSAPSSSKTNLSSEATNNVDTEELATPACGEVYEGIINELVYGWSIYWCVPS